ncbi:MAG TPA: PfkB family carbohydrate kinase [Pyrinomonadaceae bacterium]|jgi:rfaE bifunctional protein kinase chain/domain/rfaE bifunctional protein nucleotidyltransferase chain/domain
MRRNGKIKELGELANELSALRGNKRVVHCHGVFDLLHVGHIRHFQEAKKFGDVLVVTLTADNFVNKGPNRPAFTEELRAEAIAALDCVDYVAINKHPMAMEAINLIRPDFYVKGSDYKDSGKDHTGGIVLEESAVKAAGGQLVFTDDITFSSSNLINRHMPTFPREVTEYLAEFSAKYKMEDVLKYVDGVRPLKVLVVGETIIDEYQYCEAIGKSSKEPMLAVRRLSTEKFAGGVLAVANNVASFCSSVGLLTFLGTEDSQEEFIRQSLSGNIKKILLHQEDAPTLVKRRFVEKYFFTKLLEVYEMNPGVLSEADNEMLCATLSEHVPRYDVVIVVDFGHGMLNKEAIDILCGKARFLAVNAQSNAGNMGYHAISRYPRADYICIAEGEARLEARNRHGSLKEIVLDVTRRLDSKRMVVTRGKYGCLCYGEDEGFFEIPALASQVVDRMGAGDSFLSLTAPCVAQGAPMDLVGFIGNAVGAQAVATVGHRRSIERAPLLKHIETLLK